MKVGEAAGSFAEFPHQKKVAGKAASQGPRTPAGVAGKEETGFSSTFYNAAEAKVRQNLDEILARVQEQGERLARIQNFAEMEKYRDLVRSFLGKLVKDLYRIKPSSGGKAAPGQKVYVVIEKVDRELEKLAAMLVSGQAPQMRILEKVGQIKGLLLDAYQ